MDVHPFADICPPDSDLLLCFDYRSLAFDTRMLETYREIRVVGWSMGVWVASRVLQVGAFPFTECTAVNGTLYPIDDIRGIPDAVFRGTLAGLNERNLEKFYRRMCLPGIGLDTFVKKRPQRPLADMVEELRLIGEQVIAAPVPRFPWTKALIGQKDLIFLPFNQQKAWDEAGVPWTERNIPHYAEETLKACLEGFPW